MNHGRRQARVHEIVDGLGPGVLHAEYVVVVTGSRELAGDRPFGASTLWASINSNCSRSGL